VDYGFFEGLSDHAACEYLEAFIEAGRARISDEWWRRLQSEGTSAIPPYFAAQAEALRVVQTAPPEDTPHFIVEAMERDHGGFLDFAGDDDRVRVLGAAFYLGAAFMQSFGSLSWSVGQMDRAEAGQPVVTGFRTGADLPVLEVAENLLRRYDPTATSTAVETWANVV
jgi:hypothetical protein